MEALPPRVKEQSVWATIRGAPARTRGSFPTFSSTFTSPEKFINATWGISFFSPEDPITVVPGLRIGGFLSSGGVGSGVGSFVTLSSFSGSG
jgi:hypothetical protein